MYIATVVVSIALAALLLVSGIGKLRRDPMQMATLTTVGFPHTHAWLLAAAEFAGAAGLLLGLAWWPLGVAAATGVIAYFIGATLAHVRVRDYKLTGPLALLLLSAATLLIRTLSA
ncbi:DoxX family protein [Rhodococcus opacus]|uniref:DoxX family protein n=1 Tax=Rhodococcus opacus TaxID=37919 RepID=UPI0024B9682F|nr:DoxX family protein [Rhodococcus opacus]MDJ0420023.1 DoxX family protein [Rhodococcus opacus]